MKSVIYGSVAGASPMLILTIVFAIGSLPEGLNGGGNVWPSLWLAILPLVVATPLVLGAALFVGLPLTLFLKRNGLESGGAYIGTGIAVGFALPILVLLMASAPAGYEMALLGAVGGGVTGRTWWVSAREQKVDYSA